MNLGLKLMEISKVNKIFANYITKEDSRSIVICNKFVLSWEAQCHYNDTLKDFVSKYTMVLLYLILFPIEFIFRVIQQLFRIVPDIYVLPSDENVEDNG